MLIDITDTGIKKINFKRNYDTGRFQRTQKLYRMDRVRINSVDYTIDSNGKNYKITAVVRGNSGLYSVTINIKNSYLTLVEYICFCVIGLLQNVCG